jgi:hypothetical protein
MRARIIAAAATQMDCGESVKAIGQERETRMLPGDDQLEGDAARLQRVRDRGELDGFGAGADDQPYVGRTQTSP